MTSYMRAVLSFVDVNYIQNKSTQSMRTTVQCVFVVLVMILSISFFSSHQLMIVIFQRDQLRLGVDEIMDRFNPSVKHHTYEVHFIPVVRRMGSER